LCISGLSSKETCKDRIINVDDEDSNDSFKGLSDLDTGDDAADDIFSRQHKDTSMTSPTSSIGEDNSRGSSQPSPSMSRDSDSVNGHNNHGHSESEADTQISRPKIWSVSDLVSGKSNGSDLTSGGRLSSSSGPAVVISNSQHGHQPKTQNGGTGYFYLPTSSHSWGAGRYGALGSYPLPITHTTLSYPYTLSSNTPTKAGLGGGPGGMPGLVGIESLHRDAMAEKLARSTNGIFSPARELDGIRPAGKYTCN
jgi:hypothetical protein